MKSCICLVALLIPLCGAVDLFASIDEAAALFGYDTGLPLEAEEVFVLERDGVRLTEISFDSPRGGRVTGYLVRPPGDGPFPAVVFGHWVRGTRREFLPEAMLYGRSGAVCVLIDFPFSRPDPWRRQIRNLGNPESDYETYLQSIIDLRRAVDLIASMPEVDAGRIAYIGHDFGAQCGAILAAVEDRIGAAVLMAGAPTQGDLWPESDDPRVPEFIKRIPGELRQTYIRTLKPLDSIRFVPHAAPTALFFQFSRFEDLFTEESLTAYAEAASEPKRVEWYETDHTMNDVFAVVDRARWLEEQIGLGPVIPILTERMGRSR